ncbi:MAG: hypothetical protein JW395_3668 [Nitrospira sp.]|nr:hypothetical protein [Nitrospira sp.]
MSKRCVVAEGQEFIYPADPISLRLVREAGGVSKLTPEERAKIKFKTVKSGEECSDLPEPAFSIYVERGWILVSESSKPAKPVKPASMVNEGAE